MDVDLLDLLLTAVHPASEVGPAKHQRKKAPNHEYHVLKRWRQGTKFAIIILNANIGFVPPPPMVRFCYFSYLNQESSSTVLNQESLSTVLNQDSA
ncbi:hypothetical protein AVEN_45520-1 [Araneus ventricosus]|uniref:Uncharacterized protein n=1 Tax=Araneus ventricosus TaxID=182803 RepID=A0A4Y2F150_ARAVE|nr:hypothetical protein AVEN_45520-1 [Araneus ventricosus]